MQKHKKAIAGALTALIIIYVLLYLIFLGNGPLPVGTGLDKSDWLGFAGSYLSFAGTIIVSLAALAQASYYNEMENKRRAEDRLKVIQPLFSVEIISVDQLPQGCVEVFNPGTGEGRIQHQNVQLRIRIANDKPARNICVFEEYVKLLLKPDEKLDFSVCFEDSPDSDQKSVINILHSEYESDDEGLPKSFNIEYDDVDGHTMIQTFELHDSFQKKFYSLKEEPWEV